MGAHAGGCVVKGLVDERLWLQLCLSGVAWRTGKVNRAAACSSAQREPCEATWGMLWLSDIRVVTRVVE